MSPKQTQTGTKRPKKMNEAIENLNGSILQVEDRENPELVANAVMALVEETSIKVKRVMATGWDTDEGTFEGTLITEGDSYSWTVELDGDDLVVDFEDYEPED